MTSDLIPAGDPHRPRRLEECEYGHWHWCSECRQTWPCIDDACRLSSGATCGLCLLPECLQPDWDTDDVAELYAELGGEGGGA